VSGVVTFLVSILTAFTGYLSQQNFDAQWIGVQAKDSMNSVGAGAFFNVLNFGQIYGFHIFILPVAISLLIGAHLFYVRLRGVVRPYPSAPSSEEAVK
jgi:quinol-cytochrome oxidoreductase complex cytochrome b subunit